MEFSSFWYLLFWSIISQVSIALLYFLPSNKEDAPIRQLLHILLPIHGSFSSFYTWFLQPITTSFEPFATDPNTSGILVWALLRLTLQMIVLMHHIKWYDFFREGFSTFFHFLPYSFFTIPWMLYFYYSLLVRFVISLEMNEFMTGFFSPFGVYPFHSLCFALSAASLFSIPFFACQARSLSSSEANENCLIDLSIIPGLLFCLFFSGTMYVLFLPKLNRPWPRPRPRRSSFSGKNSSNDNKSATEIASAIEFPLGLLAALIAHYYIQEKSVSLLLMLSSCASYWLANLAMTQIGTDLGILNFLIGAILDCALSLYGLTKFTWIAFVYCVALGLVRWKLKFVTLQYPDRTTVVNNWINVEKNIILDANGKLSYF